MQSMQSSRKLRLGSAVGAGALALGMMTVGASVVADSGSDQAASHLGNPKKSKEAVVAAPSPKKSKEAVVALAPPKKSKEAAPTA
ncbi:hypothetical protein BH18ACT9_BH18ACT9_18790 [soil metagenome]